MQSKPLIYLASPYTHEDKHIQTLRFIEVCRVAGRMLEAGHHLFVPISMSHPIQEYAGTKGTWEFWKEYDEKILGKCDELWVVTMPGWEKSTGVQAEIKFATENGIPITYIPYEPQNLK